MQLRWNGQATIKDSLPLALKAESPSLLPLKSGKLHEGFSVVDEASISLCGFIHKKFFPLASSLSAYIITNWKVSARKKEN